jgi:tRNA1Val (adenine37-N6)-methyltransferase
MSNPFFRFKQFTVYHDLCAMKVGVDGVILGAWADCRNIQHALDIGTGSGLIALMLAQRSGAYIHAIDIDENACKQAKLNFNHSPFDKLLSIEMVDFKNFSSSVQYDLIVSNPPYFAHSLQSPDKNRSLARHNEHLPLNVLIEKSASLLSTHGKAAFILPFDRWEEIQALASENQLFLCRKTLVSSIQNNPPKRILLEYSFIDQTPTEDSFYIGRTKETYSDKYKALTEAFYL